MASEFEEVLKKSMFRIAVGLEKALKLACPVDKGILRNSIKVRVGEDGFSLMISMVFYGKHVEFGTNPIVITPKTKQALAFKSGGDKIVVKRVKHPGTRPNPFIRTTLRTQLPRIILGEIKRLT